MNHRLPVCLSGATCLWGPRGLAARQVTQDKLCLLWRLLLLAEGKDDDDDQVN